MKVQRAADGVIVPFSAPSSVPASSSLPAVAAGLTAYDSDVYWTGSRKKGAVHVRAASTTAVVDSGTNYLSRTIVKIKVRIPEQQLQLSNLT